VKLFIAYISRRNGYRRPIYKHENNILYFKRKTDADAPVSQ